MINYENISAGLLLDEPMSVGLFQNMLSPEMQALLNDQYPINGFNKAERLLPPGKLYSFSMMKLVENGSRLHVNSAQVEPWSSLIDELLSEKYKNALSQKFNLNLSNTKINIGLYRFTKNNFVDIHLDHEHKILTQLFYFNLNWNTSNGGFLQLLRDNDRNTCFLSLPPLSIYSVAIVRGNSAWHAVEPISALSSQDRLSLQLEFYRG